MYSVSQAFLNELKQNSRIEHLRGTVGNIAFTDENIISANYTNRCSDTKEVSFGLAYVGQLQITLVDVNIPRGSWKRLSISLEYGLEVGQTIEWIPVGVFDVDSALWTDQGINITANDRMTRFDKQFSVNEVSGSVYSFLNWACLQCNVTLGMTQADCEALPNGSEYLGLYPESDIKTFRDFIGWIAQVVGGFATINRSGALVVRSWADSTVVDTFTAADRIVGSVFSDFETDYNGISINDIEENTTSYYKEGEGVTISLGSNPLLQYGTDETKNRQRVRLMNIAREIEFTPFSCSLLSNPVYDLGDAIIMTGGVAGDNGLNCCIMSINWTPKALTEFQGYGSDPSLSNAKSTTDKKLDGKTGGGTNPKDKITLVTYTNTEAETIGDEWETIAHLRIGVMESQTIKLNGVVKLNLTSAGTVYLRYVLNGTPLLFTHVCQFPIGEDTITLFLPIPISNEFVNDIKIDIMSGDGAGTIDVGDVNIALQGTGVTTGNWDGYIEIKETYSFPFHAGLGFSYTETENTGISLSSSIDELEASDSYSFPFQAGIGFSYSETNNTRITTEVQVLKLTTEDGLNNLTTEDGLNNIITEG